MRVLAKASLGANIADVVRVEFFDIENERLFDLLQEESSAPTFRVRWGKEISKVEGVARHSQAMI